MNIQNKKYIDTFNEFNLNENKSDEIRYRIVSWYGADDRSWIKRFLTKDEVRDYFIKNHDWTIDTFNQVGIEYFMDDFFTHYVEIDNVDDKEDRNFGYSY